MLAFDIQTTIPIWLIKERSRNTYVFVHTLSTFAALAPYRRALSGWLKSVLGGCPWFYKVKRAMIVEKTTMTINIELKARKY